MQDISLQKKLLEEQLAAIDEDAAADGQQEVRTGYLPQCICAGGTCRLHL